MNDATTEQWARLYAEIKRARITAGWPKRARFARDIDVNDSTVAIAEGDRAGRPPSGEMLDYITSRIGWPSGAWRQVLAGAAAETVSPASHTDQQDTDETDELRYRRPEGVSEQQWAQIRARGEAYLQGLIDQAASER